MASSQQAADLAARTGLEEVDADRGLRQLEASGFVLRGRFTQSASGPGAPEEWCDRRLLARIHRYTLERLRSEIEPVTAQDYMRFLLRWHHLAGQVPQPDGSTKPNGRTLLGRAGVRQAVELLQGFEAPAAEWEESILRARVEDYVPAWLDELCLGGEVAWARLSTRRAATESSAPSANRSTPVALAPRAQLATLLAAARAEAEPPAPPAKGAAAEVYELLRDRGALFFDELVALTRRLPTDVERGLRELIAGGLVASDGFQGLRQVAGRARGRAGGRTRRRLGHRVSTPGGLFAGMSPAGRWALVRSPAPVEAERDIEALAEQVAEVLLRRYGVVFRDAVAREPFAVPWREVLRALRRMEARGTVRGGRFVTGFVGEQYALPEAVDSLRRVRREPRDGERVTISACDPLNLTGVILPGARIPSIPGRTLVLVDGAPLEVAKPAVDAVQAGDA
jgi:ATP-dependent Lhr-like helicase